MNKVVLINIYGGPSTGKSSIAALMKGLLAVSHENGLVVEAPEEVPKSLVWDENYKKLKDQYFIFSQQLNRIKSLISGNADIIISDSPPLLSAVYSKYTPDNNDNFIQLIKDENRNIDKNIKTINIYLNRKHQYKNEGRNHNEQTSIKLSKEIKELIYEEYDKKNILEFDSHPLVAYEIINMLNKNQIINISNSIIKELLKNNMSLIKKSKIEQMTKYKKSKIDLKIS